MQTPALFCSLATALLKANYHWTVSQPQSCPAFILPNSKYRKMFISRNKDLRGWCPKQMDSLGGLGFAVTFVHWSAASLNDRNDQWYEEGELKRKQAFFGDDRENLELQSKEGRVTTASPQNSDHPTDSTAVHYSSKRRDWLIRTVSVSHWVCARPLLNMP